MNKTIDRARKLFETLNYGIKAAEMRIENERLEKAINRKYGIVDRFQENPDYCLAKSALKQQKILYEVYKNSAMESAKSFFD